MFPALALGQKLTEMGSDIMLITDDRGARFITSGVNYETVPSIAFFGKSIVKKVLSLGAYFKGVRISKKVIDSFNADAVVGFGGYTSFPAIQAARAKKIPYFLIEQNSVPGRVTRLTQKRARLVFFGIPPAPHMDKCKNKVVITGNILRKTVVLDKRSEGESILVQGGSQGARSLNNLAFELAAKFPGERFILISGKRDFEEMTARVRPSNLEIIDFAEQPEKLYARAKIAISRSGAMALSELMVNGIPSIFVPFPYSIDKDQLYNASWARDNDAAYIAEEGEIDCVEYLLKDLIERRDLRKKMSVNARRLVPTNAADIIAERIEQCLAA